MPISSNRLAGLRPLSIMDARRVARLMRSGRLVKLPRASAFLTASMSSRGGLRSAFSDILNDDVVDLLRAAGSLALAASCALSMLSVVSAAPTVMTWLEDGTDADSSDDSM